jgi:MFS family permease
VAFVAIPFAVLAIGGSASDVGYVATASLLPMIAFLLVGGVAGDRFPRHKVMMAANGLQPVAQPAAACLVGLAGPGWEVDAASFAIAAALRAGMRLPD